MGVTVFGGLYNAALLTSRLFVGADHAILAPDRLKTTYKTDFDTMR